MEVKTDITRRDLVQFNLYMLPHLRANFILVGVIGLGLLMFIVVLDVPDTLDSWLSAVIVSLGGAVGSVLVGFALSLVWMLFAASGKAGVLGKHVYTISDQGFHERTQSIDTFHKWSGIQSLLKSNSYIFFRINSYLFYVIPKRAFSSEGEYEEFWNKANRYWKQTA